MPKNAKGCYEKIGYPKELCIQGVNFSYAVSGATRMLYFCPSDAQLAGKVMPARQSVHWSEGWTQNAVEREQNAVEREALTKLAEVGFVPRVLYAQEVPFENTWGQMDVMDVLVVTRLGCDMEKAAEWMNPSQFCRAYSAAMYAMKHMAAHDVIVPDPWPYNLALVRDGDDRALPCDFGGCVSASDAGMRQALKKLFKGFRYTHLDTEWEAIAYDVGAATVHGDWMTPSILRFWESAACKATAVRGPPPPPQAPPPPPAGAGSGAPPHPPSVAVGSFVLIKGLVKQGHLNGRRAIVQAVLHERFQVKTEMMELAAVRPENLECTAQPSKAWVCKACKINAYWLHNAEMGWTGGKGKWKCPQCSQPPPRAPPPGTGGYFHFTQNSSSWSSTSGSQSSSWSSTSYSQSSVSLLIRLGLAADASKETVKLEYRKWLLHAHPDKGGDPVRFTSLHSLWQALFLELR